MIHLFVSGEPRGATNVKSKKPAMRKWQKAIQEATAGQTRLTSNCEVRIDFVLPASGFDRNNPKAPYGADVDNLASAVLDALKEHVLPDPAGDNAVAELLVTKRKVREGEDSGALITVTDTAP